MSKSTGIAWCDSTANAVIGCTKVSPGCANCYAANDTPARVLRHRGIETWGAKGVRSRVKSFEANMLAMNRRPWICDQCGFAAKDELSNCPKCDGDLTGFHKRIIFCDSNSDWLDEHWPIETFAHYLDVLRRCDQCTLILCTKRTELWDCRMVEVYGYANKSVPEGNNLRDWLQLWIGGQPPKNIILLASVENQVMADKRIPQLLRIPAACHGLSLEPLLSPVDLSKWIWKDS